MATEWTLSQCFAHYGAKGANQRWSWSARTPDSKTVVLTLWQDQINRGPDKTLVYDDFGIDDLEWIDRPGNTERLKNLRIARDQCDGHFRVVIVRAKDVNAKPRSIQECYPRDDLRMRITDLNDETGEFRAVSISSG